MTDPLFFGFGSLVNAATHAYELRPIALENWERVWVATTERPHVYLSAQPKAGARISGVLAPVPGGDWRALDIREKGYVRVDISSQIAVPDVAIYQVDPRLRRQDRLESPILLSYLDVVVQGFDQLFGANGVAQFFATTQSWDRPILDDRAAPLYPRHQQLTMAETALVDGHLEALSAQIEKLM